MALDECLVETTRGKIHLNCNEEKASYENENNNALNLSGI